MAQTEVSLPDVEIIPVYTRKPWLGKKGITGLLWQCENVVKIEIACDRDVSRVLQTVPHEYKHVLQFFREGIPSKKLKDKGEAAAWMFSSSEMLEYVREVGGDWCCIE